MNQVPEEAKRAIIQWALARKKILLDQLKEVELVLQQDGFPAEDVTALVPEGE